MEDKELLELAAKAAEVDIKYLSDGTPYDPGNCTPWNPITNDGDALRLAARLKLNIEYDAPGYVTAWNNEQVELTHMVAIKDDEMVATRRAITRAAAEIGKSL